MHTPFPIRNDADYARALEVVTVLWDAEPGTPDADTLEVMTALVAAWEARRRELPAADPREVIAFKLRELGWTQRELARRLGWGSGRVSEILSGKRPLTLRMVRELASVLDFPPGLLVHDVRDPEIGATWVRLSAETVALVRELLGSDTASVGDTIEHLVRQALVSYQDVTTINAGTAVFGTTTARSTVGALRAVRRADAA